MATVRVSKDGVLYVYDDSGNIIDIVDNDEDE